jgi:hypothetical protein
MNWNDLFWIIPLVVIIFLTWRGIKNATPMPDNYEDDYYPFKFN